MTRRPATLQSLIDDNALLKALLAHGRSMAIAIDAGYRILWINRVVDGMQAEQVIGTSCLAYMPPDDHLAVRRAIDETLRTGQPGSFETRGLVADGSFGSWVTQVLPVDGGAGATRALLLTDDLTARRRAEEALASSEERLRLALDAARAGLWDLDVASGACHYSPAFHTMLGYPPDSLAPRVEAAIELLHPEDREQADRALALLREPGHYVLRFRMRTADGGYRWIESHGQTVRRNQDGEPARAVGIHVDITEGLEVREALRASEALLRSIVEGTTDAIFVKDREGRYLLVNQAWCTMTGCPSQQILGRDASVFLAPEAAQAMREIDLAAMADGAVHTAIETLAWVGGGQRHFQTTKGPLRDERGQVVGLFGVARDLTDVLRQQEAQRRALEDSRNLLEAALSGTELGVWETDLATGESRFDDRYLAMLGYGPGELGPTERAWRDLIHPDDRAAVDEAVGAHARGETRIYEVEHRLRHKEGHWLWVLARGKTLRDREGRAVRAVGTHQDISERRRAASEGADILRRIEALLAGLAPRRAAEPGDPAAGAGRGQPAVPLSRRHQQVLALLADGLTAPEIARRLGISPETAHTHRRDLMRKLGLRNKAELIRYALEHGLQPPG